VLLPFNDRTQIALELRGSVRVSVLPVRQIAGAEPLGAYVWLGTRGGGLYGVPRRALAAALADPSTAAMIIVGPHPLSPLELAYAVGADMGNRAVERLA